MQVTEKEDETKEYAACRNLATALLLPLWEWLTKVTEMGDHFYFVCCFVFVFMVPFLQTPADFFFFSGAGFRRSPPFGDRGSLKWY